MPWKKSTKAKEKTNQFSVQKIYHRTVQCLAVSWVCKIRLSFCGGGGGGKQGVGRRIKTKTLLISISRFTQRYSLLCVIHLHLLQFKEFGVKSNNFTTLIFFFIIITCLLKQPFEVVGVYGALLSYSWELKSPVRIGPRAKSDFAVGGYINCGTGNQHSLVS